MFGRHHQNFITFACQKINTGPVKHLTSDHSENLFVSFHNAYSYLKHGRYYLHKLDIVILILHGTVTLNKMRRQYRLIYLFGVINIKSSTILRLVTYNSDLIAWYLFDRIYFNKTIFNPRKKIRTIKFVWFETQKET